MTAPPDSLRGSFDPSALSTLLPYDTLEHIPDLQPGHLATLVYARMRKDPRLATIHSGYTLQIRRAAWQLDPTGCRPEVMALVADDMGLPVKGQDIPTAARVKGVSWSEHLRTALLSLTYGHMPFEMWADYVDGRNRLAGLSPRMPHTLSAIHQDPKTGDLLGITQDHVTRRSNAPQISADRLAFYCHERETTWFGTSLLRPSYAPWYLKQELIRVHGTSARRFGMGVPTVEWAAGTNPTPEQIQRAQQVASAARVGEESGASLPPGASLVLRGLSGSTPDVLGYIKWLNAEMASAALMPHIDLGVSETGSRAVATAFVDSWVLALGAIAEEIADVATRQIAARLVEWNFPRDEPVPRVVVSGVGTQREATAEALKMLLDAGALSADPALEAWVRREFKLPERELTEAPAGRSYEYDMKYGTMTINERRAQIGLPLLPDGDRVAERVDQPKQAEPNDDAAAKATDPKPGAKQASPKRRGRRLARGQMALFAPRNETTTDETFAQMQADWAAARDDLLDRWVAESEPLVDELAAEAADAVDEDRVDDLGDLAASAAVVAAIAAFLSTSMTDLGALAAAAAVTEVVASGREADEPEDPGSGAIVALAAAYAASLAGGYAAAAGRKALTMAGPDVDRDEIAAMVREHLRAMSQARTGLAGDTFGASLSSAQTVARHDVFAQFPDATYVAVESNDVKNRCEPCDDIDGRTFGSLAAAQAAYSTSGYVSCDGGARCRGGYTIQP